MFLGNIGIHLQVYMASQPSPVTLYHVAAVLLLFSVADNVRERDVTSLRYRLFLPCRNIHYVLIFDTNLYQVSFYNTTVSIISVM
jgi:hypothetical protein